MLLLQSHSSIAMLLALINLISKYLDLFWLQLTKKNKRIMSRTKLCEYVRIKSNVK